MWGMLFILAGLIGLGLGIDYLLSRSSFGKSKKTAEIEDHSIDRDVFLNRPKR